MTKRLLLGTFEFDDGQSLDEQTAHGWFFTGLTDWEGLSESKDSLTPRPSAHGSFLPGEQYRESAIPSFRAVFVGDSASESADAVRSLVGMCGGAGLIRMTLTDDDGVPLWRMVRVKRVPPLARRGGSRVRVLDLYVEAPDPLLYGAEVTVSTGVPTPGVGIADPLIDPVQEGAPGNLGRVEVINTGTAPTSVRLTVTGGLSEGVQIQVVETGEVLRLERLIPDGSKITFNSRTGRAVIDDQSDVTGFMTVDQWPQVPEHSVRTFQFVPLGAQSGTPTLSATYSPASF